MRKFRRFAMAATIATYFLIFFGSLVRVSGAGLGCPDWPKCFDRWIPPINISQLPPDIDPAQFNFALAWIEYFNRLIGMTVGILIAITGLWALYKFRSHKRIVIPAVLAAFLVAYQGWQGGRMVEMKLIPYMISIHMGLAFILVSLMTYLTQKAWLVEISARYQPSPQSKQNRLWVGLLTIISIMQVISGSQVRQAIDEILSRMPLLVSTEWWKHVGLVDEFHMITGVLVAIASWQIGTQILRKRNSTDHVNRLIWVMMILSGVQVLIGAVLSMLGVPALMQIFHLLISTLFAGSLVMIFSSLGYKWESGAK